MANTAWIDALDGFKQVTSSQAVAVAVVMLVLYLLVEGNRTNFSKIKHLPEVPGALPFVGHLNQLGGRKGKNDCSVFTEWGKKLGNVPMFQCRMGDQRTIVVGDYATIIDLWVGHTNDLIDRPHQPGFVDKLGVDLTGFPMTPQIRKCRAAAMKALAKPAWPKYYPLIEPSSARLVEDLYNMGKNGHLAVDCYAHLRQLVFDLCLSLSYGVRFGKVDDAFMLRFIKSINDISAIRSSSKDCRHFVPLLRILPGSNAETIAAEKVRAKHVDLLYKAYQDRVASGETVDCIVSSLGGDKLTEEEIHGTCISLLQAAPDTVASGVYQTIAWISSSAKGREVQQAAYTAILEAYGGDRDLAWKRAFREEKVPLISSIGKESLRFFTVTPYSVPRRTARDIQYGDVLIPKGITIIMNAQEANHSSDKFGDDAWEFQPERFIGSDAPLPHLTFGAGSRICPAVALSNRIMYAMLVRLILAFEMETDKSARMPNLDAIGFSEVYSELVAHPNFYDCKFVARDEAWLKRVVADKQSGL